MSSPRNATVHTCTLQCRLHCYKKQSYSTAPCKATLFNCLSVQTTQDYFGQKLGDKISHVDLLHSVTNQNFNCALPHDETKTPDLKPVETMIRLSRLRYTGHVLRMDNTRLPKILLNGEINIGKRKVGRPQQNYRSCIKEDLKLFKIWNESPQFGSTQLPELTSNREQWRKLIHKGAEIFQKEWERKKIEKSIHRKSNC